MPEANASALDIPADIAIRLSRTMMLIRRFEEKIVDVYGAQDMKTPVHLCIGQEAIAAGVCENLRTDDYVLTTHRGHGHCLAKGASPRELYAEFYGRRQGCAGGKGGSMHPVCPDCGVLGASAIVGGSLPHAVGAALAIKMQGGDRVAVAFFGDGATDEGVFHESLNFAALKKLPVIFVCENNFYAVSSPILARRCNDNIVLHAQPYDMPNEQVDSMDVLKVYHAAHRAVARARAGEGPTLLECRTYRWKGHVGPEADHEKGCRPKEELEDWMQRCPVEYLNQLLLAEGIVTKEALAESTRDIDRQLDDALHFARQCPFPDPREVLENVYHTGA